MYNYPKKMRLRSKKLIASLFENGHSNVRYPLRLVWMMVEELPENVPVQSAVSVSKKRFKRAVKRNLLKRRMREAIRLNIHSLYPVLEKTDKKLALMLVFISNDIESYQSIETALKELFSMLNEKILKEK